MSKREERKMAVLENLEPKKVFHFFEEISKVPRGTFDTKKISDFCVEFAKERNLEYIQDDTNNVIIKKPGTAGYENSDPVIIQGHLDMVCEKRPGSTHDFKKDGLELYVEDGFVKAKDTTLGADDGIAVAMAMALLDSDDIPHPPIEAVFTIDEETGMYGAIALDFSNLKGKTLINVDSEIEGILTTGCAGGINIEARIPFHREKMDGTEVLVKVHGLLGGHSGMEIDKQRGNANKMMGRLLDTISKEVKFHMVSINGGSKDNVIAQNCEVVLLVDESDIEKVKKCTDQMREIWTAEFVGEEPTLELDVEVKGQTTMDAFDDEATDHIITYIIISPNGLVEFSRSLKGLVETSLNMGVVSTNEDHVKVRYQMRSSFESKKQEMRAEIERCCKAVGAEAVINGEYPAWQYNPESKLQKLMSDIYEDMYGKKAVVFATHGGLECGFFMDKCPGLDCVSMGPDMLDVHSFNEKLDIASTERTWDYLKAILAKLK